MKQFSWPVRVYWEDTDAGGVVYYANYLKYMERARTEWLRALGLHQWQLKHAQGIVFVVTELAVKYFMPARLDDELLVVSTMPEVGGASLGFIQRIVRAGSPEDIIVTSTLSAACLDAQSFKPRRLPPELRDKLQS
jgi:acyl-CoA thioester hydrolase